MATVSKTQCASVAISSWNDLVLYYEVTGQSVADNTSTVKLYAYVEAGSSGQIVSSAKKSYTVTVDGSTLATGTTSIAVSNSSSTLLWSGTTTISHGSDGTKSFTYKYYQQIAATFTSYVSSVTATCTITLPTIARASSITSASAVSLGGACSVKWTPYDSSFTYKITFSGGGVSATTSTITPSTTSAYTYSSYTFAGSTWGAAFAGATSVTITATLTTYNGSTTVGTATKTFTLSAVTTSLTSAAAVTLGNACSVKWTPPSSAFYYKLKFTVGSTSVTKTIGAPGTSAYTYTGYTMDLSTWGKEITTSTTGTCTVTLYTYTSSSYSTAVGNVSKTFTVTVPSTAVPSVSFKSISEANSDVTVGVYVQKKSAVKVVCTTGTASDGYAAVSSCKVKIGSTTYTGTTVTSGTLSTSGDITITATVTDSRGMTNTASTSITVYSYSSPSISKFTAVRVNTDGNEDSDGEYVKLTYSYTISELNSENAKSAAVTWSGGSSSGTLSGITSAYSTSSLTATASGFSNENTYTFTLSVSDSFTTVSKSVTVGTSIYPLSIRKSGTGVAVGKLAESDNLFDVGVNAKVRGYLSTEASMYVPNGYGYMIKDSNGDNRTAISLDSDNLYHIAVGGIANNIQIGTTSYTSTLNLRGSTVAITGAATVSGALTVSGATTLSSTLTVSGNITGGNNIYLPNGYGYMIKDSNGDNRTAISLNSENLYQIAVGGVANNIKIGTTSYTSTLGLNGTTIAITGAATVSSTLTVSGKIYGSQDIILGNPRCLYGTDTSGNAAIVAGISSSNNYLFGTTSYVSYLRGSTLYLQPSEGAYKPYYCKGDTISSVHLGAGYVTSSKQEISFTIPLSRPIIGSPTVTVAITAASFRQNNSYTHGTTSTASDTSFDSSVCTGTIRPGGLQVQINSTTTTNAVNNAPIGIRCSYTITLS